MPRTETIGDAPTPKRRTRTAAAGAKTETRTRRGRKSATVEPPVETVSTAVPVAARPRHSRSRRPAGAARVQAGAEGVPPVPPTGEAAVPAPDPATNGPAADATTPEGSPASSALPAESPVESPPPASQGTDPDAHSAGSSPPAPGDQPSAAVRQPFSRSRSARPTFKQTVLRAAEERFRGDRVREPITPEQVDDLLVLLHQVGHPKSLVDSTWDFLRNGMSKRHAEVQIEKFLGTFAPRDTRAA